MGEILQRSAASMNAANTSLEKTIALGVAAQTIVQDEERVGSALNTLSMRLRGATTDLENAGEEVDEYAASTSKMRDSILQLTGFDIMADEDTFKDMYEIMGGIAEVYGELTDVSRANVAEILFGKMRANVGQAILSNFETARDVLAALTDGTAAGSAMKEYNTYLDSVEASQNRFEASFQSLSKSLFESDLLKFAYDSGTGILGFLQSILDSLGSIPTLATVAAVALRRIFPQSGLLQASPNDPNKTTWLGAATKQRQQNVDAQIQAAHNWVVQIEALQEAGDGSIETYRNLGNSVGGVSDDFKNYAASVNYSTQAMRDQISTMEKMNHPLKNLGSSLKNFAKNFGMDLLQGAVVWGIFKGIELLSNEIDKYVNRIQYAQEAAQELDKQWEESQQTQKDAAQAVEDYGEEFVKLREGVNQRTGQNLTLTDEEFSRYQELANQLGDLFPELVSGWDAQGNAILGNVDSVDKLTEAYEWMAQASRDALLAQAGTYADAGYMAAFETNTPFMGFGASQDSPQKMKDYAEDTIREIQNALDFSSGDFDSSDLNDLIAHLLNFDTTFESTYLPEIQKIIKDFGGVAKILESPKGLTALMRVLPSFIAETENILSSAASQYQKIVTASLDTAFSPYANAGAGGVGVGIDSAVQSALRTALGQLGVSFFEQFGRGQEAKNALMDWVNDFAGAFASVDAQQVVTSFLDAVSAFDSGEATLADVALARQDFVNGLVGILEADDYDALAPVLRDALQGNFDEYLTLMNRAFGQIEAPEEQIANLSKKQLQWLATQDTTFGSMEEFTAAYEAFLQAGTQTLEALRISWEDLSTAQASAREALDAQTENQGRLDRNVYNTLMENGRQYTGAISTFDGEYVLDAQKVYAQMNEEAAAELEKNQEALAALEGEYQEARAELIALMAQSGTMTAERQAEITAQQELVASYQDEIFQRQILIQTIRQSTSALTRWQEAQNIEESGDVFRSLKTALDQITEGVESGRTNTNRYQAAGDLLFGAESNWRSWTETVVTQAVERASKLYDEEGQLDNAELYRQLREAGMVTDQGLFTQNWGIQDLADALGYGTEFMAQTIRAAQEYGDNRLDFSDEELAKFIPETEVEANTGALQENTAALQSSGEAISALAGVMEQRFPVAEGEAAQGAGAQRGGSFLAQEPQEAALGVHAEVTEDSRPLLTEEDLNQTMTVTADTGPAASSVNALEREMARPVTKQIRLEVTSSGGSTSQVLDALGTSDAVTNRVNSAIVQSLRRGGSAFASGTQDAPEGLSLVGEEGPEIYVNRKRGTWHLADTPQLANLESGDMVFNAEQTRKMLKGVKVSGGKAFARGTDLIPITIEINGLPPASNPSHQSGTITNSIVTNKTNKVSPSTSSKKSSSGGGGGGGGAEAKEEDIMDKISGLYDWVSRALEVAAEKTQTLIDTVSDKIGAVAKNNALDDALEQTAAELELNEQGYAKYMETAAKAQKEIGLSQDLVKLIQQGAINVADYDDETRDKIEAYQEWYNKAEDVRKSIEELKEQQQELAIQKLDNIVDYYDRLNARLEAAEEYSAAWRDYMVATGQEITSQDYVKDIDAMNKQLQNLQAERQMYVDQMNQLMAQGVIDYDSDLWHDYTENLEDMDAAILDINTDLAEMANEIDQINITNLQYALDALQNTQAAIEGLMSFHEAQGSDHQEGDYVSLIQNGFQQIQNLEEQNAELERQQEGLDKLSERYQELQAQINNNAQTIWDMKAAQEQWNDAIADLQIAKLEEEREALEKENDALQKKLDMEQAIEDLAKARQRRALIFREDVGFTYESNLEDIQEAQDRITELQHQETLDKIDEAIQAIEDSKADDNVYNYEGTEQIKAFAAGGVNTHPGIAQLDGTPSHPEVVFNASDAGKLYDMVHNSFDLEQMQRDGISRLLSQQRPADTMARNVSVQFGDIRINGVKDAEGLANALSRDLEAAMMQALFKQ